MKTITLYLHTRTKCYSMYEQGRSWSLSPWSGNTSYYEGYSEAAEFILPDGLELCESVEAGKMLGWKGEKYCTDLHTNSHVQPYVFTPSGHAIIFKRVGKESRGGERPA